VDLSHIKNADTIEELEKIRVSLLGKNGIITKKFKELKNLGADEKKKVAKELNEMKQKATESINEKRKLLEEELLNIKLKQEKIDVTLFNPQKSGAIHPVTDTMNKIIEFFTNLNFSVESGPLIEDDFHNFEALNLPKYHPARDMQDTFYFKDGTLLRTHTSPVQIRTMLNEKPPIRIMKNLLLE